ncbi:Vacuolar protein sorting-associated protein 16-like protein [Smittium culicis]|uniref:Probable vacuolar protein sorting-associated protein 16 homolog n=1 Tax=Smittium culicis TaxID=133412 RepID=A0A1R1YB48_9FUNG|nr:Vacuolar protein sorting-associated protein 16-like protein [Smittium culicis]
MAAAPYGALIRDHNQLVEAEDTGIPDGIIAIFSPTGKKIGQVECDGIDIVDFGWCLEEKLVCIQNDGNVRIIDLSGDSSSFSLGKDAQNYSVKSCRFWDSGFVVILGNLDIVSIDNLYEPKPTTFKNSNLPSFPHCWQIIPPQNTLSGHVEVLLSIGNTIITADASESQDQFLQQGPFSHISVSPNGKLVALLQSAGKLQVITSDFQKLYTESYPIQQKNDIDSTSNSSNRVYDVSWCGNDGVAISYGLFVVLVGPFGGVVKLEFDSISYLVQEIDSVRIFNLYSHDILSKVSDSMVSVFQAGSTSPAALLYDAYDHLQNQSAKADEIVRNIGPSLGKAIDTCIEAAGCELNVNFQQSLLKASSFGKTFLPDHNPTKFVDMCSNLKVLNTVRSDFVGLYITIEQFHSLPINSWILRLLNRNMHFLALKICEYLKISTAEVYIHWAISKIKQSNKDDDTLYSILTSKLQDIPSLSYVRIAEAARLSGRERLTTKLLQLEPISANKVPLLLAIGSHALSLKESVNSGNVELIYLVILGIFNEIPLGDFFRIIGSNRVASLMFQKYCKQEGKFSLLKSFYFQEDELFGSIESTIIQDFTTESALSNEVKLINVQQKLESEVETLLRQRTISASNIGDFNNIPQKSGSESASLSISLNNQLTIRDGNNSGSYVFIGLTLLQTLAKMINLGMYSKASSLKSDFNIPESTFYWIKLRCLVRRKDFIELDKFCRLKKPPIGYVAFAEELISNNQFQEASRYISLCDNASKPNLYLKIGFMHEAAESALLSKNINALKRISTLTSDPTLKADIEARLSSI